MYALKKKGLRHATKREKRSWLFGILFILPSVAALACMVVYPLILTFLYSVNKVLLPNFDLEFVGLSNFVKAVGSSQFPTVLKNTLIWTFGSLLLRFLLGFICAMMMETGFRGKTVFRVLTLLPWVMPSIVASNLWRWIYNVDNGILNYVLKQMNPSLAINWLGSPSTALMSVIMAYVWTGFPYIMLMLVAGLQGIPKEYTEAAQIDGANSVQVFWHVTLPQLKSFIIILTILEIISGFNSFDLIFTMTGGGPGVSTEILGLNIYRTAFQNYDFGAASAIGVVLLLIVLVAFLFYAPSSKKRKE